MTRPPRLRAEAQTPAMKGRRDERGAAAAEPRIDAVKHEIGEEHRGPVRRDVNHPARGRTRQSRRVREDPARNRDNEALKNVKGARLSPSRSRSDARRKPSQVNFAATPSRRTLRRRR